MIFIALAAVGCLASCAAMGEVLDVMFSSDPDETSLVEKAGGQLLRPLGGTWMEIGLGALVAVQNSYLLYRRRKNA